MKLGTDGAHVAGCHGAEEGGHHVRRERHVVEIRQVGDPLAFAETAGLLEVGHDDVPGSDLQPPAETVRQVDILARANWCAGFVGDLLVGVHVLGRNGLLQPHQVERLQAFGHLEPGRQVVAGVHIGADVDLRPDRLAGSRQLVHHALDFAGTRGPVDPVILVRIVGLDPDRTSWPCSRL